MLDIGKRAYNALKTNHYPVYAARALSGEYIYIYKYYVCDNGFQWK